tara:strand:+ start:414 stop:545 length:132 start_codon:yes stop_codon:yes gene_type:complete
MNDYKKLEWIHYAILEALDGNNEELIEALALVEDVRENHISDQ